MTLSTPDVSRQNSINRVWESLESGGFSPDKRADKFMALCPVHGDSHRSLSVSYDRRNELTMLHCFTCNADVADITAALGLTVQDTFDKPLPDRPKSEWGGSNPRRQVEFRSPRKLPPRITQPPVDADELRGADWGIIISYPYTDEAGTIVQEVVREHAMINGTVHKRFTQRFRSGTGRMVSRKPAGFAPVLYNHGAVVEAIAAGKPVWLVEGEKDADNATALGLIATTNAQGAGSFPQNLADVLAGGKINIVADRDVAGFKRAATLHELFTAFPNTTVRIMLPAVLEEKADLTDHLEGGLGIDALTEISAEDASMLAQLGEARKALSLIEVTKLEATAHIAAATGADSAIHKTHAESWAGEAEARFRRLNDSSAGSALLADNYGPDGKAAAKALQQVVDDGAQLAAEVHSIAGLHVPNSITDRLEKVGGRVIDLARAGGAQPPVYRGNDFIKGDDGSDNVGARFIVRQGETVQVKVERDGDEYRNRYHRIMRGWAEIQNLAFDDDGSESSVARVTHQMKVNFYRWSRDADGRPVLDDDGHPIIEEKLNITWDADQIRDGSWVQTLPWPGMLESNSRRGKDITWDAIFSARPSPVGRSTIYTTTGWRETPTGAFFVHSGGGIAKGGSLALDVELGETFSPFKLPEPTLEVAELKAAWAAGTATVREALPARIIAPLLGVVWESVFERVPMITHLVGGRAAYKTSTARLACQYFAPELHYHGRREILSGSNMGGTIIGVIRALAVANHMPVLIDDMAPDGDAKKAQRKLSELARLIYNGTGRVTGKQRGGISSDAPTKATVITTGEIGITGSGQTRLLNIPLDPGAIADGSKTFAELEKSSARRARGLLGASLIQWIAQHREALILEKEAATDDPNAVGGMFHHWQERTAVLPHDEGLRGRLVEAAMSADHGIKLMLRMMVTNGAMTRAEADEFYQWAETGIFEAISMQDAASGDPAEQMLGYLRDGLTSGAGHITDENGRAPENADVRGWNARGSGDFSTWTPNGPRVGIIKGEGAGARLYLIPAVVIGLVNQVAQRADETFSETSVSISSALISRGWLAADKSGKRQPGRRINGQLMRVWDIPLAVLDGEDGDETTTDGDETTPPRISPSLFDLTPSNPDAPTLGPITEQGAQAAESAPAAAVAPAAVVSTTSAVVPRQTAGPATKKADDPTFRASLAVLHTDGLWLPDGEHIQLAQPIAHLGDIAKLVAELNLGTKNGWKTEDGQILVTGDAALDLGIPVDQLTAGYDVAKKFQELTRNHPLITGAVEAGYSVGGKEPVLNTTTRIWHEENPRLRARFVLIPTLKDDFKHIVDDNPTPLAIARRLQRFADELHTPYVINASTTGLDLLFTTPRKKEQRTLYFAPSHPVPPAEIATLEADIDWQRKPTETEAKQQWIHAYDRGGSYLAGVSGLELGYGEPRYYPNGISFDKKLPGYWRITMPAKNEWLTPNPIDPRNREDDISGKLTWVSSQTLDIATSLGYEADVVEAYVWENHTRIYDTWYERVRDARTALDTGDVDDARARDLLKEVYVRSLGLTASFEFHKNREGFAPERYHFIQARARANILRRVQQIGLDTGRWPVAISKDTVIYTSDEIDQKLAWPGKPEHYGRGLGQYKYEGSAELVAHLEFLTGRGRYDGKSALTDFEPF